MYMNYVHLVHVHMLRECFMPLLTWGSLKRISIALVSQSLTCSSVPFRYAIPLPEARLATNKPQAHFFLFSFSAGIVSSQMHMWPYLVFMWKPNSAFISFVAKFLTTEPYFSQMVMTYDVFAGTCMQVLSKTDNASNHRVMSLS